MPAKSINRWLEEIEKFHSDNLYLPTRTIYFGGIGNDYDDSQDEVNCKTCAQLLKNLYILEHKEKAPITILLSSPGGSWEDGIAVYDYIKKMKSPVKIIGMGKLYSMGSVIFQAGDKRFLQQNTLMMIHDGSDGYCGDSKAYEAWAKISKHIREVMYKIYYVNMKEKKPRITLKEIEDMCGHDFIMTSKEAVKMGLADKIL